jgi:hypothetical protein
MEQLSYKGYAQRTGFDPIKAPDQTSRILQEGNRVISGMRAVQQQERQNNQEYLAALQQKNNNEERQRDANKNLQDNFRRSYQQAVQQNYKTRVDDAYRQASEQENIAKKLSGLSETMGKLIVDYGEKRAEADELAGRNAVFESGITYEEAMQLRAGESQLDAADQAYNNLANQLQERGVSMEQIASIRKMSGRRWYGAMQAWALDGADNYASFRAENADREFDINGETFTIATAQNAGPEVWAAINAQLRTEYLKQYKGIDNKFLDKYLFPGMRQTEAQEKTAFANARQKALTLEYQEQQRSELYTDWKAEGPQGVLNWIQRTSGGSKVGLRNQRLAAVEYLKDAINNGDFTSNDLEALDNLEVTLNGSSKPQRFGDLYKGEVGSLRKALREYNLGVYRDGQQDKQIQQQQYMEDIMRMQAERGPYSQAEIDQIEQEYEQRFLEPAPNWIQSMKSVQELQDSQGDQLLQDRVANGTLTMSYLNSGQFSTSLRLKYRQYAQQQEQSNKQFSESAKKAAEAALKETLGTLASANQGSMFYLMQPYVHQDIEQRARRMISEGAQADAAYQKAGSEVVTEINSGTQGKGRYARKMDPNSKQPIIGQGAGFTILGSDSGQLAQRRRAGEIRNQVNADSSIVNNKLILNASELKQVEGVGRGGSIPPVIWQLSAMYPRLDPFAIMDRQLELAGKPALTKPPEAQMMQYVRPELQRYLTNRPSLGRTARASYLTAGGAGSNQPYQPILDLIASKESQGTDPQLKGYDALNRGGSAGGHVAHGSSTGTKQFGRALTQMTVGEIMDMQARGELHATGRYQIIASTLKGLVNRGVASRSDRYDQATQDRLAISLLHGRAGKFFSGTSSADAVIPGLGQEWIGLQYLPAERVKQALVQAKNNLNNPRFDVNNMRDEVVYRVGDIGPTSTAPHLDVKQEGGRFFARASLDNFIAFQTPKGLKPLSSGVTVNGGQFGAPRNYGPHLGWDYAVPEGTPVVLRNGARYIAKRATEHGDQLTVALPDGRRFSFLHGKAVK